MPAKQKPDYEPHLNEETIQLLEKAPEDLLKSSEDVKKLIAYYRETRARFKEAEEAKARGGKKSKKGDALSEDDPFFAKPADI